MDEVKPITSMLLVHTGSPTTGPSPCTGAGLAGPILALMLNVVTVIETATGIGVRIGVTVSITVWVVPFITTVIVIVIRINKIKILHIHHIHNPIRNPLLLPLLLICNETDHHECLPHTHIVRQDTTIAGCRG